MTKEKDTSKDERPTIVLNSHEKLSLKERMMKSIVENDPLKKKGVTKDASKGFRK